MTTTPSVEVAALVVAKELYEYGCYSGFEKAGAAPTLPIHGTAQNIQINARSFVGLAVHAVGHEVGVDNPKVHVYALRASKKVQGLVPKEVGGYPLVLHSFGRLTIVPAMPAGMSGNGFFFLHGNRIACGSSCAPATEQIRGTMGALVTVGGELCCLSNNHVFSGCNHLALQLPIMSPAMSDTVARQRAPREVAHHRDFVELRSGIPDVVPPNKVDLAVATVVDADLVTSWQGDDATGFDTPTATLPPTTGMRVKKVGRTTGLTVGIVESLVNSFTPLPYKFNKFYSTVWFTEFWVIKNTIGAFALGGDSGSLIVDEAGENVIGLLFAATSGGDYGLMIPWSAIETHFGGISLVNGLNVAQPPAG